MAKRQSTGALQNVAVVLARVLRLRFGVRRCSAALQNNAKIAPESGPVLNRIDSGRFDILSRTCLDHSNRRAF